MKKQYLFLLALLISATSIAQQGINYKALIKDVNGDVVANTSIRIQLTIQYDPQNFIVTYAEEHVVNTDANGVVVLNIGEGNQTSIDDPFSEVPWSYEEYYLKVEVDITGGTNYVDLGTTQFMAVPYAKYAEYAHNTRKGTLNDGYRKGGPGAGRSITANHGKVAIKGDGLEVTSSNDDIVLHVDGPTKRIGIGTDSPKGALDVVTTNDTGLVIPRVSSVDSVTDGQGNPPENGTIVYDLSKNSICFYLDGKWACGAFSDSQNGISFDDSEDIYNNTQAYFKSEVPGVDANFGQSVAISDDGNTLAIGSPNADFFRSLDPPRVDAGLVVMYRKINNVWTYLRTYYPGIGNTKMIGVEFGYAVSLNADGTILAVGARYQNHDKGGNGYEYCTSFGVGLIQFDQLSQNSGGVWIFNENGNICHVTAPEVDPFDIFGHSVSLDNSGYRLVVGSIREDSNATGVDGDATNNSTTDSGAVYVYDNLGQQAYTDYVHTAYIKASNTDALDRFGYAIAVSGNGEYIVVGATLEDSASTGINGDQTDNSESFAGAGYVFYDNGGTWEQQAYIKSLQATATGEFFGNSVSIDDTGNTIAIGAPVEGGSNNGDTNDPSVIPGSGAVYVLKRTGTTWNYEAYLRSSHSESQFYGESVALSGDGTTLLVGAKYEFSNATGVNPNLNNGTSTQAGAAFLYTFAANAWGFTAHIKPTKVVDAGDFFGQAVALNADGSTIIITAPGEDGSSPFMNGNQFNDATQNAGAAYLYQN